MIEKLGFAKVLKTESSKGDFSFLIYNAFGDSFFGFGTLFAILGVTGFKNIGDSHSLILPNI
jgi:hypothetical protein